MITKAFEGDHLSYSSVSGWLMCAANWKFHYIDKVPAKTSTSLVFGSAFHGAIESFLAQQVTDQKPRNLLDCWEEAYKEATTTVGEKGERILRDDIDWRDETPESLNNDGVRILSHPDVKSGILSIKPALREDKQFAIETKIELRVPGVPLPIIGYIDIITTDGIPGDFKTSSRAWSDSKAGDEIQTLFYLAALNQAGITVPDWAFRHYVFVKTKTPQFQVFTHTHNPSQLMWLFKMVESVWKGIEADVFPINPTTWKCSDKWCEYFALCRGKYQ